MMSPRRHAAYLLVIALTACSSASDSDRSAPSPAPSGSREIQGEGAALTPGRYTFSPFEPRVTFEVGEGFEGGHTNAEFFDVFHGETSALAFASPSFVTARAGGRLETADASPEEVVAALRAGNGLEDVRTATMTIGTEIVDAVEGRGRKDGFPFFGGPGGEFGIVKGDGYRIAPLEVEGKLVLVMQLATEPPFERAFAATDPILPTIDFGVAGS
jgi:hypothetical protein